ncbi:MAG TPA: hypothetical protein VHD86_19925 [Xanthobacteraceae bacterium]|nr:hypothetical protein [Xanthobacteraceae bacterium]
MSRNVYLVGSVPMANTEEVFSSVSAALGSRIKRLPDGETGERGDWITWLEPVFAGNPAFVKSGEFFRVHSSGTGRERYTLKPGVAVEAVQFPNLFYADVAAQSYAVFKRLKDAGKIPPATKFQVDLVPAHSVVWLFLVENLHASIDPIYNDAVKREIDKIAAIVPHGELAIQFDIASAVFARLERNEAGRYGRTKAEMQDAFAGIVTDLGDRVPAGVDLLYHLCYGDSGHRHVVEPTDMGDMVEFANRVSRQIARPIELIHMPVPRNRADDAYFAPLRRLELRAETELCLGLVHYTDGVDGARARLGAAQKYVRDFSIATECGFGRRDPATIPALLRLHAEIADLD